MQRRAAAAYVAIFLVVGAGAYGVIATAQEPAVSLDNPNVDVKQGGSFTAGGQKYEVTKIEEKTSGGGHGGGGTTTVEATIEAGNESITVAEGDTITLGGTEYIAHFPSTERVQLTSDKQDYTSDVEAQHDWKERINGFWGVVILSGIAAFLLAALAYMPPK